MTKKEGRYAERIFQAEKQSQVCGARVRVLLAWQRGLLAWPPKHRFPTSGLISSLSVVLHTAQYAPS